MKKKPFGREDVDEELRFHFDKLVEDLTAAGLDPAEAQARAAQRLGNLDEVRAQCAAIEARRDRTERRRQWLSDLRQDLRLALRQLWHRPAFAAGVVLTLALGLGANYAIFAALDGLVLHPLRGVAAAEELVDNSGTLSTGASEGAAFPVGAEAPLSLPAYRDFRDQSRTLQIAGFCRRSLAVEESEVASAMVVSGNYFETLRPHLERGRPLSSGDDLPGAPLVAVVSHRFAQRHPEGQLRINGMEVAVVGVAARDFHGTRLSAAPDLWLPFSAYARVALTPSQAAEMEERSWGWIGMVGRLRPGSSLAAAQAELSGIASRLNAAYPDQLRYSIALHPLEGSTGPIKIFAAGLAGVVLLVLVLACANVANLLLSRAATRRKEIAVRTALGATRARVVRQLLTEALVLALCGAALGLALAHLATQALPLLPLPDGVTLPEVDLAQDRRVLSFAAVLALVTTLLFGLPPALQATRARLTDSLKGSDGRERSRLRDLLLVTQVALSVVLLIGAGLFLRALERGLRIDPGFRPERLAYATMSPGLAHHGAAQAQAEAREIAAAVSRLPGVTSAALTTTLPLSESEDIAMARPEGRAPAPGEDMWLETMAIGGEYLETMGLPLLEGRSLQPREPAPVMLLSRSAARKFFPGPGGALGRHIVLTRDGPAIEVVGVVADARYHALEGEPRVLAYLPLDREPALDNLTLIVRSSLEPRLLSQTLRAAIQRAGPGVPVLAVGALQEKLAGLLAPQRLGMTFLGAFAVLGFLLAFVGTASVTAFALAQRTREFGIRLALGAQGRGLLAAVLGQTLRRALLGLCIGAGLALLSMRGLAAFLYGVPPADPLTFAAAGLLMLLAGLLAALIPARRIFKIDPAISLRSE